MMSFRDSMPRPLQILTDQIRAHTTEIFAFIFSLLIYPLGLIDLDSKKQHKTQKTPLLLIHGYLHNRTAWTYMRRQLEKVGFGTIYTINLGHPLHSIEEYAQKVAAKAVEIEKLTGRKELDLVGHSMGGLVALHYATTLGRGKVKNVVTLGSPLQGTALAPIAIGQCAKEMRTGTNPFLKDLQERVMNATNLNVLTIGSESDVIIIPNRNAFFSREAPHIKKKIIPYTGHLGHLFQNRNIQYITSFLNTTLHPLDNLQP